MHNNGKDNFGKFDAKSDEGIFLGYSTQSKAYKVLNKRTNRVEESMHVLFDESTVEESDNPEEHPPKPSEDLQSDEDNTTNRPIFKKLRIYQKRQKQKHQILQYLNQLKYLRFMVGNIKVLIPFKTSSHLWNQGFIPDLEYKICVPS